MKSKLSGEFVKSIFIGLLDIIFLALRVFSSTPLESIIKLTPQLFQGTLLISFYILVKIFFLLQINFLFMILDLNLAFP